MIFFLRFVIKIIKTFLISCYFIKTLLKPKMANSRTLHIRMETSFLLYWNWFVPKSQGSVQRIICRFSSVHRIHQVFIESTQISLIFFCEVQNVRRFYKVKIEDSRALLALAKISAIRSFTQRIRKEILRCRVSSNKISMLRLYKFTAIDTSISHNMSIKLLDVRIVAMRLLDCPRRDSIRLSELGCATWMFVYGKYSRMYTILNSILEQRSRIWDSHKNNEFKSQANHEIFV